MRQLRRKWLMVLPILAISTMASGQVFHDALGGPGTYGNPYGWLGNAGANAWEQYRHGTGTGSVMVPNPNQPVQSVNAVGNNSRVSWQFASSECPWQQEMAGPLGTTYLTNTNYPGLFLNRTASGPQTDPANLFYYKWMSDMFWQRWTGGQAGIYIGFMEDASGYVTAAGGDTATPIAFQSDDPLVGRGSQGVDLVVSYYQFQWAANTPDDEYVASWYRAGCMPGTTTKFLNHAAITHLPGRSDDTGNPSSTLKKVYTGNDANWYGDKSAGLGITTVDYVLDPTLSGDDVQCDPCWPHPPAYGGPNYEENNDANNPPAIEWSAKIYATDGSVANSGTDKYAPNTGDGNDWSSGDIIFQVKAGATVMSMRIDTTDAGNTPYGDSNNWEDGTFDWQNATPFIGLEHGSWNRIPCEMQGGIVHPGDTNTDGTIDYSGDISFAVINYGTVDTALHHGDVSQDGQVDYTGDISLMVNAYGTYATDLPPPSGELELVIDYVTGEVSIVANSATNIAGFEFKSPDGSIITGSLTTTGQFSMNLATSLAATEFNLSGGSALDGTYSLGNIFAGNQNWTFGYNFVGGTLTQTTDDVTYVPEPATLSLVVLGGLGLLLRRRRR